jgi:choline dehydrogenase
LQSTDPLAPPLIQPNTFSERADLRPIIEGIKLTRRLVQGQAMRPFLGEEISPGLSTISDEDLTRHICETFQTVYHPVGTCKMGSDGTAVVDTDLRVHGLERLRVVDASIMPTIIGGHIHAPTVMIAEKAAEMIKQGD